MGIDFYGTELDLRTNYAMFDLNGSLAGIGRPDREKGHLLLKAGEFTYRQHHSKISEIREIKIVSKHPNMNSAQDKLERTNAADRSWGTSPAEGDVMPWPTKANPRGYAYFVYDGVVQTAAKIEDHLADERERTLADRVNEAEMLEYSIRDIQHELRDAVKNINVLVGYRDTDLHHTITRMSMLLESLKGQQKELAQQMNKHLERIEAEREEVSV